ncbi:ABC transporter permease [Gordonia sp. SID5947]|uniref:FtsX-like permease family protein n=1 Tax=Gordonia sp. SID5947 TaxID=2690315 RepID=UPI001368401B|nr:ABC transporter permease [Gordonia sp. SID5947]MYR07063.1 ABC transporter permease [Gordonia sp. SID5947]
MSRDRPIEAGYVSNDEGSAVFIGIRDVRFAKWRFVLIGAVIAMMTFMVVALSALTGGLKNQSISAISRLPGQTLVLRDAAGADGPSLSQSELDAPTVGQVVDESGDDASELGVTTTRIGHGRITSTAAVFGAGPRLTPPPDTGRLPGTGGVMLGREQATALAVTVGDLVTVDSTRLRVDAIGPAGDYAHTPVAYTAMDTWRALSHGQNTSAVVLFGGSTDAPGTTSMPMSNAADAVPGYRSERGSLLAIQAMLLAISTLVVGAFFAVWTVQRLRDLAVVRALGAGRWYLLRDGIGQAALVLLLGETVGVLLGVGLAAAAAATVPISLSGVGVALPVVAMAVLGSAGALLAVRRVTVVDPVVAMSR